ncbi:MAG: putative SOS response-associated peptidase YedK [Chloroflexi bacterium]|nr:putative SOS response-associated peptidase YedK [Chloroflexota bacterium]
MCGRFTLAVSPEELQAAFPNFHIPPDLPPSYNIAPGQPVPVLPNTREKKLTFHKWGLVPSWAKDKNFGGYNLINARGETVAEKASFRAAYRRRRCLIPADGFYEWRKEPSQRGKTPYYIYLKNKNPFAFAGLWEIWHSPYGDELHSCCIITTKPNEVVKPIHNRMPVILAPEEYPLWLASEEKSPQELQLLLDPYPAGKMAAHPVSTFVNSPRNNSAKCVQPAPPPKQLDLDF